MILDSLKTENINNGSIIRTNENSLNTASIENEKLKAELKSLKEQIQLKDQSIKLLAEQTKQQEQENNKDDLLYEKKMDEQNESIQTLVDQCEQLRTQAHYHRIANISHYLDNKFSTFSYDEIYTTKNITKDIIDFLHLTKIENKPKEMFVIKNISALQEVIMSLHLDYQIKVCGSFATGLNLPWSAIDLVLIPSMIQRQQDFPILQTLYIKLQEFNWVVSTALIDTHILPIVYYTTNDQYGCLSVNISVQNQKYNYLLCVELTKYYMNAYLTLEPLILSLKQILKNSSLLAYPVILII